jgi:hypothetical protein
VALTSITDPAGNTVASTEVVVFKERGILERSGLWPTPQDTNGNPAYWTVVYTAGLFDSTAEVDAALKRACKMLVKMTAARPNPEVSRKSVGNLSLDFRQMNDNDVIPKEVMALLWPYRSVGVV